jgi:hypothetical protein
MPAHPVPLDAVARCGLLELLPQILVLDWFAIRGLPVARLPLRKPFE